VLTVFIGRTCGNECGGGGSSLGVFYRPEGGQERGQEGMCVTTMVDLQCVGFNRRMGGKAMRLAFQKRGEVQLSGGKASPRHYFGC
jgi:hypothetical protein